MGRLDVAMFNAILRESAEEMPTDPVSDPISDPKVLPIPAGNSSFGAGAQLKNAVSSRHNRCLRLHAFIEIDFCDMITCSVCATLLTYFPTKTSHSSPLRN